MVLQLYNIGSHNAHYEGAYAEREMAWRRAGAVEKVNNLQCLLGSRHVGRVLEVGCGTGAVLAEIARRGIGSHHVGVDVSPPSDHSDPGAATLQLENYDGVTLPYDSGSFDLVVASHVVEHVHNPRAFLDEVARVSGSLIYVEVPCEANLSSSRLSVQRALDIGHINIFTPESWLVLLQTTLPKVLAFQLFDHTDEVYSFRSRGLLGKTKVALRRSALAASPVLAGKLFTYHCGALASSIR